MVLKAMKTFKRNKSGSYCKISDNECSSVTLNKLAIKAKKKYKKSVTCNCIRPELTEMVKVTYIQEISFKKDNPRLNESERCNMA